MKKKNQILKISDKNYSVDYEDKDHILFVYLGAALTVVQKFEFMLFVHLGFIKIKHGDSNLDVLSNKTLGYLVRLFNEISKNDEMGNLLKDVRDKRNILAHEIIRKYDWPMMTNEEYINCLDEIGEIHEFVAQAHMKLAAFLNKQHLSDVYEVAIDPESGNLTVPGIND